jgi:hypothetical protein
MIAMPLRRTAAAAVSILCFAGAPALADGTTDAMRKAEALYREGQFGKAYHQLEDAAADIAHRLSALYAKTYPAAPAGWSVPPYRLPKKEARRGIGRGVQLVRHYRQNRGRGIATAQLIADDRGLITALAGALQNPEAVKRMKGAWVPIKAVGKAIVAFDGERKRGDIRLLYADRFYITITARHIESRDFLIGLLAAWDFAGLRKASGLD